MSRSSDRGRVRSSAALRHPAATDFHAPHGYASPPALLEAPYMFLSSSCPTLPNLAHTGFADSTTLPRHASSTRTIQERLARRVASNEREHQQGAKLATFRNNQRSNIVRQMKMDRVKQVQRLQNYAKVGIERWTKKTKENPFGVDLWKEDSEIYETHQKCNALNKQRHERLDAQKTENRARKLAKACGEVDELAELRKEKKRLVEKEKELKARMDLDKVNRRLAFASKQQEEFKQYLENNLRKRGTLLRAHSDFFTDELGSPDEEEQEEEEEAEEEEMAEFQAQARKSVARYSLIASPLAEKGTSDTSTQPSPSAKEGEEDTAPDPAPDPAPGPAPRRVSMSTWMFNKLPTQDENGLGEGTDNDSEAASFPSTPPKDEERPGTAPADPAAEPPLSPQLLNILDSFKKYDPEERGFVDRAILIRALDKVNIPDGDRLVEASQVAKDAEGKVDYKAFLRWIMFEHKSGTQAGASEERATSAASSQGGRQRPASGNRARGAQSPSATSKSDDNAAWWASPDGKQVR